MPRSDLPKPSANAGPDSNATQGDDPAVRGGPYADVPIGLRHQYLAPFDRQVFLRKYSRGFPGRQASHPDLLTFLGFMERDQRIADLRWMAYMLATVQHETGGRFRPRDEVGHGVVQGEPKRYHWPVKVARALDGSALVTEQDGDQWRVLPEGTLVRLMQAGKPVVSPNAKVTHGARGAVHPFFTAAPGTPLQYYGRDYVQLTWWDNYVRAGVETGEGLLYLFEPERVKELPRPYRIISTGMIKGTIFANGHRLRDYFFGGYTNYVRARAMVNGREEQYRVACYAEVFEEALMASHVTWIGGGLRLRDEAGRDPRTRRG